MLTNDPTPPHPCSLPNRGAAPGEAPPVAPILSTSGPKCSQIHVQMEPPPVSSYASVPSSSSLVTGADAPREKTYNFDNVFGPEADQGMVYQAVVSPVLNEVLSGYNCTIFAYGQTGTGKTHTMEGDLTSNLGTYSSEAGIIPRTLYRLFHQLELSNNEYAVHASFVELYNEELRDLLSADLPAPLTTGGLKVYDDKARGVVIQGLEDTPMRDAAHGLELLRRGSHKRQIAATRCNENSSRSHSVFTLTVHTKETTSKGEDVLRVGKLNLVDLAGSENIGRSGAENKRAREAGMINQSLLTLGRVINALVEKSSHVPYRESKLTRLLQESLGGRTKTCIIATVSAEKSNLEETMSTLDYALRAKSIRNRPEMNSRMTRAGLIMEYVKEIERLKRDVLAARTKEGFFISNESWKEMQDESDSRKNTADELRRLVEVAESKRTSLQEQFEQNMQLLLKRDNEVKTAKAECADKKRELDTVIDQARELQVALQEETELREAYKNSERKLDRIASGLRQQAEENQSDLGGLFAKLERKTKVESANQKLVADYRTSLDAMTAELESKAGTFHTTHDGFTKSLGERLEVFHEQEAANLQSCQEEVKTKLASLEAAARDLGEEQGNSGSAAVEFAGMVKEAQEQLMKATEERSCQMRQDWADLQAHVTESHAASSANIKKALHSFTELVGGIVRQTQAHLEQEREKVSQVKTFAEEASEREIATLREQNELLAALVVQERQKSTEMRERLGRNIMDLLVGYTEERDRSLTEAIGSVQTKVTASEEGARSFVAGHAERMDSIMADAASYGQAMEEKEKVAKKFKKRGDASLQASEEAVAKGLDAWTERMDTCLAEEGKATSALTQDMASRAEDARAHAEEAREKQASYLAAMTQTAGSSHAAALSQLSSTLDNVFSLSTSTTASVNTHRASGLEFLESTSSQLAKMRSQTRSYFEDYYSHDVPTGSTPQKREPAAVPAWRLVPGQRSQALEQYRHLVAKKRMQQQQGQGAGAQKQQRLQQQQRGERAASLAPSDVDGSLGTLPDDSRATVDIMGNGLGGRSDGFNSDADAEGEHHDEGMYDDMPGGILPNGFPASDRDDSEDEEEEVEDSLGEILIDSDDTVKVPTASAPSGGGGPPVSGLRHKAAPAALGSSRPSSRASTQSQSQGQTRSRVPSMSGGRPAPGSRNTSTSSATRGVLAEKNNLLDPHLLPPSSFERQEEMDVDVVLPLDKEKDKGGKVLRGKVPAGAGRGTRAASAAGRRVVSRVQDY